MKEITLECTRRMRMLKLQESTINNFRDHDIIAVSTDKKLRAINMVEFKRMQSLYLIDDIKVYHAVSFTDNDDKYLAFLITTTHMSEWEYEFLTNAEGFMCFALIFKNSARKPSRGIIQIHNNNDGVYTYSIVPESAYGGFNG